MLQSILMFGHKHRPTFCEGQHDGCVKVARLLQWDGAVAEYDRVGGIHQVDDGRWDAVARTGVDEQTDIGFVAVGHFNHTGMGVVAICALGALGDYGGGEQRPAQFLRKATSHVVVGDSDAYLFAAFEYFGQGGGGRQDESEGAWQIAANGIEGVVVDTGKACRLAHVGAHDGEMLFLRIYTFDAAHALYGSLVGSIATYGIKRVGGIDDEVAGIQGLHGLLYEAEIDVTGENAERFHKK